METVNRFQRRPIDFSLRFSGSSGVGRAGGETTTMVGEAHYPEAAQSLSAGAGVGQTGDVATFFRTKTRMESRQIIIGYTF
jgi:hypothetical protein